MIKKKVAIIKGLEEHLSTELTQLYFNSLNSLEVKGYEIKKVNLPEKIREHLQITYLILCCSELVSHLNSLQGITYGVKDNISITQKRSKYLGKIVKQRLLMGAYFLEQPELIKKAQQIRRLVDQWVKKIFRTSDFLILPCPNQPAPKVASFNHSFAGLVSSHWSDNLLLIANFAGLPSCSLPIGLVNDLPVSININSAWGKDKEVLDLAKNLER